jgi:hypothetical protein
MIPVEGTCDERFGPVREAMAANLASGEDLGCSVAIVLDGQLVVDLWGGHVDEARTTQWEQLAEDQRGAAIVLAAHQSLPVSG